MQDLKVYKSMKYIMRDVINAALLFSTINTILLALDKDLQNSTMYTKATTLKGSTAKCDTYYH